MSIYRRLRFLTLSKEEYLREREKKWNYVDIENTTSSSWSLFSSAPQPKETNLLAAYKSIVAWNEQLKELEKIARAVADKQFEVHSELVKMDVKLAEFTTSPSMLTPASGIKVGGTAGSTLKAFSDACAQSTVAQQAQFGLQSMVVYEKIHSWVGYARSAQQLIERYAKIEANYNAVDAQYQTKREKLNSMLGKQLSGGVSRTESQQVQELEALLKAMEPSMQQHRTYYNKVKATIWDELKRYDKHKAFEAYHWVEFFGERQVALLTPLTKEWSKFSLSIK